MDAFPESDLSSDAGPVVPSTPAGGDGGPVGAEAALSFRAAYARSLAVAYFVILALAALSIGLRWPLVEWAFDARRLFR